MAAAVPFCNNSEILLKIDENIYIVWSFTGNVSCGQVAGFCMSNDLSVKSLLWVTGVDNMTC